MKKLVLLEDLRKNQFENSSKIVAITLLINAILFISFNAKAQLNVTGGTSTTLYGLNASTVPVDPLIAITSSSNISGFKITISSGLQSSDVLSYTGSLPSGISATAYNSTTGVLAFTGSTTAANWETLLRTVSFSNSNTAQAGDRTITFSAGTSSAFSNGHYYELITPGMSWTSAKAAAASRSYLGYGGYLATISSAAENNFIRQVLNADAWMGASDEVSQINAATGTTTYANQAAAEGKWYWVTGPEKGTYFSNGNGSPVAVSSNYMNWNSGEPNNSGSEHYGQIYSSGTNPGAWNDLRNTASLGYVVEYGGLSTDPVQTISSNTILRTTITENSITGAQSLCNGITPSSITGSSPKGGNGSYTYRWICSTTSTTSGFSLAPGTATNSSYSPALLSSTTHYRRVVNSGVQTDTTTAISIVMNPALTSSISQANVSCFGGANGSANIVISGGSGSINYSWVPSGGTGATASGLTAGSYTCTATDGAGCTASRGVTISQPAALSVSSSSTNSNCFGTAAGSASVSVSGGTSPYSYNWSNGVTTSANNNILGGIYTCTITDNAGCSSQRSVTITQPSAVSLSSTQTNVTCNGLSTGAASISASGGTAPYTYSWSSGQTTTSLSSLSAGTYTCAVTDANSCPVTTRVITITQPLTLTSSASSITPLCNGDNNGSATITPFGGTSPYTYSWSNGGTSATRNSLSAGTYTCTITDVNGCSSARTITLTQPSGFGLGGSTTDPLCNGGADGSASIFVSGGTSPYTYLWSNGGTSSIRNNLSTGTYTCSITDLNGCTSSRSFFISQPAALSPGGTAFNVGCNGGSTGRILVSTGGGTMPFSYLWSNGVTTANNLLIPAGTYSITITDANGCIAIRSYTVNQPSAIAPVSSQTNVSCNGGNNGSASFTVSGGTSPYTYFWSNGGNTSSKSSLSAGTYTCTITDANGCTSARTVTLTQPSAISTTPSQTDVLCNSGGNGSATINVTGGTAPYSYAWSGGGNTSTNSNLVAGIYTCTITDNNSCTSSRTITITEPSPITLSSFKTNIDCNGQASGSATIVASGGTAPYTYSWSNGGSSATISSVTSGTYTCSVTDANSCPIVTRTVNITQPTPIISSTVQTDNLCNGAALGDASMIASGGTGSIGYMWSNGLTSSSITGLVAGTYTCTVTDDNLCTASRSVTITEPAPYTITPSQNNVSCNGTNDGNAEVIVTGGTAPYIYTWSDGTNIISTSSMVSGLSLGTYYFSFQDANLCPAVSQTFTITQPSPINVNVVGQDVNCNGGNTGSILLTTSGGVGPYNYTWDHTSANTDNLTDLIAGAYNCLITDANGCTSSSSYSINQPDPLIANYTSSDPLCNGGIGSATVTATGGTGNYSYNWNNGTTTDFDNNLSAGTYDVTIVDYNGCSNIVSLTINEPTLLSGIITSTDAVCYGGEGDATINAIGGTGTLNYEWSNGSTTATAVSLGAGTYDVTVTDNNGCSFTTSTIINQPSQITAVINVTSPICNGGMGSAEITANGGAGNFVYQWSNGETTSLISNIIAGTYSVQVMDSNGCLDSYTTTLSEPTAIQTSVVVTDENCGQSNGAFVANATGGTGQLAYLWDNGDVSPTRSNLSAGSSYALTVTDDNGCSTINFLTINNILPPLVQSLSADILCNGSANGTIDLTITGGASANYSILWNNGETTEDLQNLSAGSYDYTVIDSAGCSTIGSVVINEPTAISISGTSTNVISGNDGTIDLTVSGGNPNYTFMWDNGAITEDLTGLNAGDYTVIVTDINGCTQSSTFTVSSSVGINTISGSANLITIYPNPSNGLIMVKGLISGDYVITNAIGQIMTKVQLNETDVQSLDLRSLSEGVYYINSVENRSTIKAKFIIIK